jgi:hypothetical protein
MEIIKFGTPNISNCFFFTVTITETEIKVKPQDYDWAVFNEFKEMGGELVTVGYYFIFKDLSKLNSIKACLNYYTKPYKTWTKGQRGVKEKISKLFQNPDMDVDKYDGNFVLIDNRNLSGDHDYVKNVLKRNGFEPLRVVNNTRLYFKVK